MKLKGYGGLIAKIWDEKAKVKEFPLVLHRGGSRKKLRVVLLWVQLPHP